MKHRVLIIDDQPDMLSLLGLNLERAGYEISVAENAEQALARIEAHKPDLIILDVMLPRVSGLELCQHIRAQPGTANLLIMMLSARGEVADKIAGLKAGADEYVVKPVDMSELLARVASMLERAQRLRTEQAPKKGRLISFIGAKGGVGTTTIVLNTALVFSKQGTSTIAVEFRPYAGSFETRLGLSAPEGLEGLLKMEPSAITSQELVRCLCKHPQGLRVLCAPPRRDPNLQIQAKQAQAILDGLAGAADCVLVDLPPQPSFATEVAIQNSQMVVLVVEPVRDCVETAALLAALLASQAKPGAGLRLVVVNRAPLATPIAPGEIHGRVDWQVAGVIPPAADECARAQQMGVPLVRSQPEAFVSRAFNELAGSLA